MQQTRIFEYKNIYWSLLDNTRRWTNETADVGWKHILYPGAADVEMMNQGLVVKSDIAEYISGGKKEQIHTAIRL